MANSEACQLFIEQQIKEGLDEGKTPYKIGRELADWVSKLFRAHISPTTLEKRAERIRAKERGDVPTNVGKLKIAPVPPAVPDVILFSEAAAHLETRLAEIQAAQTMPKWSLMDTACVKVVLAGVKESDEPIPIGFCQCGCGGRTEMNTRTDRGKGWVKGEYRKFITGHNIRR